MQAESRKLVSDLENLEPYVIALWKKTSDFEMKCFAQYTYWPFCITRLSKWMVPSKECKVHVCIKII